MAWCSPCAKLCPLFQLSPVLVRPFRVSSLNSQVYDTPNATLISCTIQPSSAQYTQCQLAGQFISTTLGYDVYKHNTDESLCSVSIPVPVYCERYSTVHALTLSSSSWYKYDETMPIVTAPMCRVPDPIFARPSNLFLKYINLCIRQTG
ncbi:uncharacterized protein HD556DRAFT_1314847 [Suillus plorans]|uniref:Uncharacterized protein n=1 Tax=Suillus plorans TaxID=116603 RepID=A0A9P7AAQ1_9AGAM|nr:uncharacterized protein HD556DRAFT_1314847 [Suillus plorans]KAG1784722.1 hypothetical protein HD556DRAFT_1314847 [Suillus plorans]